MSNQPMLIEMLVESLSHLPKHTNGKVAWWVMQEHLVGELTDNFDDWVIQFSEHRKLAWPYDPYGPPDDYQ